MKRQEGFITILALLVITIIAIFTFYLLNVLENNILMTSAAENSIQAYYSAESKLYMLLNKDEYYYEQLIPRVKRFIKHGRISPTYEPSITLDRNDLIAGDNNNKIKLEFITGRDRQILELEINSNKNKTSKTIFVELFLINELFEMELPIISLNTLPEEKRNVFINFMTNLKEEVSISNLDEEITGIYAVNYNEINIINKENSLLVEYYRKGFVEPVREDNISNNQIFLLAKNKEFNHINVSLGNNFDNISIEGIIYVEGDLNIYGTFEFAGLMIVNGKVTIYPEADVKVDGIILTGEDIENLGEIDQFIANYDLLAIKRYGIYLPNFIDIKINKIKVN